MFYTYSQNNSGGNFTGPATYVIVEAKNAKFANVIAEENGIYFDGCSSGRDCSCCGDRWSRQWNDKDGTEKPEIYGKEIKESQKTGMFLRKLKDIPYAIVIFDSGKIKTYK